MALFAPSVEISLDNLLHNLRQIRSGMPPVTGIIAVVKDCAYGCGASVISRTLENEGGVDAFAVARASEAFALRKSGVKGTLLVLGKAEEEELRQGDSEGITFTCNDLDDLRRWTCGDYPVRFHCNIDTGMRRLGLQPQDLSELIDSLRRTPRLRCSGIFTHMASADIPGTATVDRQHALFGSAVAAMHKGGIAPDCIHHANSATLFRFPHIACTHVRPGISLYGCKPDPVQAFGADLRPVLSLRGKVVAIRQVPASTAVSYGGHYITDRSTSIATIGLGYAHGVPRYLSNRGETLIGGKRYRIAGNVTMDYLMVDAGPSPVFTIGDEAVIIGSQGPESITPDDVALAGGTIGYEVLCNIGTSLTRTYTLDGRTIAQDPGLLF